MPEDVLFVCEGPGMNIWDDDWGTQAEDWSGGGGLAKRLVPSGQQLGATLYELERGNFMVFHFHHGSEELLVVIEGEVHVQLAADVHELSAGDSVHYESSTPHRVSNPGSETAEVMFVISPPSY